MSEATCPHCKEEFLPDDLHASGEYPCPTCGKELFIEVDYTVDYSAFCTEKDHDWQRPGDPFPEMELCTRCGATRISK